MQASLVIRNGTIVDGTGESSRVGDVAIADGKIVAVGVFEGTAVREIDATGRVVAPGFIDIHTHFDPQLCWDGGDEMIVRLPSAAWYAEQVEKEQTWLPKLAPCLPLPIPAPIAMGEPADGYPWHWSVHRWIEGGTADVGNIDDDCEFVTSLAEFLAALQKAARCEKPLDSRCQERAQLRSLRRVGERRLDCLSSRSSWYDQP